MTQVKGYRHFVSLGGNCRVVYNMRLAFRVSVSYPFDWWISSLRGVTSFIAAPSLAELYDPAHLYRVMKNGRAVTVENRVYDVQLYHEFPKDEGGVVETYADSIDAAAARARYLLDRFLALGDAPGRILFVRSAIWKDPEDPPAFAAQVEDLLRALETRFGRGRFDLLLVNSPPVPAMLNTMQLTFADESDDWRGDLAAWAAALRTVARNEDELSWLAQAAPAEGRLARA